MNTLDKELATYREHFQELLAHEGKFVLIVGEEVIGLYDTQGDAIAAGYARFGYVPLLAKRISRKEEVAVIMSPFVIKPICPQ
jgi:hypothetical protein